MSNEYDHLSTWDENIRREGADLSSCPDCGDSMFDSAGEKACHGCGARQPVIYAQARTAAPLAAEAIVEGLGAGGEAAGGGVGIGGIGRMMNQALGGADDLAGAGGAGGAGKGNGTEVAPGASEQGTISHLRNAIATVRWALQMHAGSWAADMATMPQVEEYPCPHCQSPVMADEKNCPSCGSLLNGHDYWQDQERHVAGLDMGMPNPMQPMQTTPGPGGSCPKCGSPMQNGSCANCAQMGNQMDPLGNSYTGATTFGESGTGNANKNDGLDHNPAEKETQGFNEEHGSAPELLKDVNDAGGTYDPALAVEIFHLLAPKIVQPHIEAGGTGGDDAFLHALDAVLESAFPNYRDGGKEMLVEVTDPNAPKDVTGDEDQKGSDDGVEHHPAEQKAAGAAGGGVPMNPALKYWSPDEVGECISGVSKDTYGRLWELVSQQEQEGTAAPIGGDRHDPYGEHGTPMVEDPQSRMDIMSGGQGNMESVWHLLTPEQQQEINAAYEQEYGRGFDVQAGAAGVAGQMGMGFPMGNPMNSGGPCPLCGMDDCPHKRGQAGNDMPNPMLAGDPNAGRQMLQGMPQVAAGRKVSVRRPKMCPFHSELVDWSLQFGDPEKAMSMMGSHMFSDQSCKGGHQGTCNFKPQMATQSYWDQKQQEAEERAVQRQGPTPVTQEIPPMDPIPSESDYDPPSEHYDHLPEVPSTEPFNDGGYNGDMGDTSAVGHPEPVTAKWHVADDGSMPHHHHEHPHDLAQSNWVDSMGQPLQKDGDYELKSPNYEIPDHISVKQITPDTLHVVIHGEMGMDYGDQITQQDLANERYSFEPVVEVGDAGSTGIEPHTDSAPMDADSAGQTDDLSMTTAHMSPEAQAHYAAISSMEAAPSEAPERDWLFEDSSGVDVDPGMLAKMAGRDYTPREQREFIDEEGTARNLDKLDLEGTHYPSLDGLETDFLW